jgi:hypothetical protein
VAIYDIPPLQPPGDTQDHPHLTPIWSSSFDSGSLAVSPMLWEPQCLTPLTSCLGGKHRRETAFLGVDSIHVVGINGDQSYTVHHRVFRLTETITASAGAVGFRRAVWSKHEHAQEGFIRLATCTLPETSSSPGNTSAGLRPHIGSILIPASRTEWIIDLSFDEGTGRICAFIGDLWIGPRRVVIIDLYETPS